MTLHTISDKIAGLNPTGKSSFLDLVRHIGATRRQRQSLQGLDDNALKDIGLNKSQADIEAKRSIWDVPNNWRR